MCIGLYVSRHICVRLYIRMTERVHALVRHMPVISIVMTPKLSLRILNHA